MHTLDSFVVQNLWEEASYDFVVPLQSGSQVNQNCRMAYKAHLLCI